MSCPFSHVSASHDSRNGGTAVVTPVGTCPFAGISQTPLTPNLRTSKDEHNTDETKLVPIPQPATRWLIGNLSELNPAFPQQSIWRLADIYGDIYQLDLVTEKMVVVSSNELGKECFDTNRFDKMISGNLTEVRDLLGDGLFTAATAERSWGIAQQMADYLVESGKRANRTSLETHMRMWSADERRKNRDAMWKLCDELVAERKRHPQPEVKDLLNAMLYGRDPETGETMSDENIRFNMVTFLVAGHETTSGTSSFLFYQLLKNPETYQKAQEEVDRVVGDDLLQLKHLSQLKYLEACIRETLRFQGPIGANQVCPYEDTVIGGKYLIKKGQTVRVNLPGLHHDARVWGPDHGVFRPERLLDGRFETLPPCAWKPFGNGKRACIGRGFAEQEMLMAAAMTMQRFQVHMANPGYDLRE